MDNQPIPQENRERLQQILPEMEESMRQIANCPEEFETCSRTEFNRFRMDLEHVRSKAKGGQELFSGERNALVDLPNLVELMTQEYPEHGDFTKVLGSLLENSREAATLI